MVRELALCRSQVPQSGVVVASTPSSGPSLLAFLASSTRVAWASQGVGSSVCEGMCAIAFGSSPAGPYTLEELASESRVGTLSCWRHLQRLPLPTHENGAGRFLWLGLRLVPSLSFPPLSRATPSPSMCFHARTACGCDAVVYASATEVCCSLGMGALARSRVTRPERPVLGVYSVGLLPSLR